MRANLRLGDLRRRRRVRTKLINVKIPVALHAAIERIAKRFATSKTEVVVALLNEGLVVAGEELLDWRRPEAPKEPPPKRVCTVQGCGRRHVAKGYCASHYQAWRRGTINKTSGKRNFIG